MAYLVSCFLLLFLTMPLALDAYPRNVPDEDRENDKQMIELIRTLMKLKATDLDLRSDLNENEKGDEREQASETEETKKKDMFDETKKKPNEDNLSTESDEELLREESERSKVGMKEDNDNDKKTTSNVGKDGNNESVQRNDDKASRRVDGDRTDNNRVHGHGHDMDRSVSVMQNQCQFLYLARESMYQETEKRVLFRNQYDEN
ncbi:SWR1-complex protein 3-like [Pecten maximus]|uniref:SWR1-complex protein 3-like n=1 Tax=Pecten maximus TaxID=6579 RepID=UPI0014585EF3|nr:SWR1-complex protein 3-like [Pecten maximus]